MCSQNTQSWRIVSDEPHVCLIALWLRDAAGLAPATDPLIPRLDPPVEPADDLAALAGPAVEAQWAALWPRLPHLPQDAGIHPPDFSALSDSPELQTLARAGIDRAARAANDYKRSQIALLHGSERRSTIPGDVVREIEADLGRKAAPFNLRIDILPVLGARRWRDGPGRLIVTRALVENSDAYRVVLHEAIVGLV